METSGIFLSVLIVIVTITLAVLTHWRKTNKERRNKKKPRKVTETLVSTKDKQSIKQDDIANLYSTGQNLHTNDDIQHTIFDSQEIQKDIEVIYTPNYSQTVYCSTSLLTMNVEANERNGETKKDDSCNRASRANSIKVLLSDTLRKQNEMIEKMHLKESDQTTENGYCDKNQEANENLLESDVYHRGEVVEEHIITDNTDGDWCNVFVEKRNCLENEKVASASSRDSYRKRASNHSTNHRGVEEKTTKAKPVIRINIDELTDLANYEETSESGISSAESENREGFEFLSLLSPRKDKDDDETSSTGYSETDIDPAEAEVKFPNLLLAKTLDEEYVFLRAMKHGNITLLEHRILFVTGYPGSGKTSCALSIIKFNRGSTINGKPCAYKILKHFKLHEHEYDSHEFAIILFDDCFSSTDFEDDQSVDDIGDFLGKVMRARLTNEDVAFIFSIESEIWEKLLMKFSRILSHLSYAIIDLSEGSLEPNTEEKEGILRLQIAKSGGVIVDFYKDENLHPIDKHPVSLSEKTLSTILRTDSKERVGFPELCCIMCMNINRVRGMHDIGIFRYPKTLIYSHFEAMSKSISMDDRMGLCILLYAAIKNGCFDKYKVNLDLMDKITDKVVKSTLDLRSGLRSLRNGILVRLTRSKYIVQHKVITQILLDYMEQNNIIV